MMYQSDYGVVRLSNGEYQFVKGIEVGAKQTVINTETVDFGYKFSIKGYSFRVLKKGTAKVLLCRKQSDGKLYDVNEQLLKELCDYTEKRALKADQVEQACTKLLKQTSYSELVDKCMAVLAQFCFLTSGELSIEATKQISKAMAQGAKLRGQHCESAQGC